MQPAKISLKYRGRTIWCILMSLKKYSKQVILDRNSLKGESKIPFNLFFSETCAPYMKKQIILFQMWFGAAEILVSLSRQSGSILEKVLVWKWNFRNQNSFVKVYREFERWRSKSYNHTPLIKMVYPLRFKNGPGNLTRNFVSDSRRQDHIPSS